MEYLDHGSQNNILCHYLSKDTAAYLDRLQADPVPVILESAPWRLSQLLGDAHTDTCRRRNELQQRPNGHR